MIDYRLYLVTDDPSRLGVDWIDRVVAAVEGGVTCVQYRDTESDAAGRLARARRLQAALRVRQTPLIINNEAELAAVIGAEGVHVGQGDLPPNAVRVIVGPRCEIGLSITAREQFALCSEQMAHVACLGVGPVFDARKTKRDAAAAMGLSALREIVTEAGAMPAVAIGGITLENAATVLATGVKGLAVVSAFSRSADPYQVARQFRGLFT